MCEEGFAQCRYGIFSSSSDHVTSEWGSIKNNTTPHVKFSMEEIDETKTNSFRAANWNFSLPVVQKKKPEIYEWDWE